MVVHGSLFQKSDQFGGLWTMDPWANFILTIYISDEKEQKNVLFHHLIQVSGEIRHFLVQCPHTTRKCLISPLKNVFFLSQYVER